MCGIAGLFNYASSLSEPGIAECVVRRMTDSLVHRGPDAEGVWVDDRQRCILGHRRLSIIDTSDAGRQPMTDANGRWVIAFNGEIYNFLEVKPLLEASGVHLRGRTDTEVLLESVALWGIDALPKLDGMFAFAAFDTLSGELILARDAFGEKPLYYVELPGGGLAFASELQALERLPNFDAEVSLDAMAEVLMFQYVGAPRTIYRSVKKLQPGHWMRVATDQPPKIGRFFEFQPGVAGFDSRPIGALADELEDILLRSIRRRLISDVPLGAFLSGGVDSSTVCALICKKLGLSLKTFSIGFRGAHESEHEAAREFARHIGSDHHDQILSPDTSTFLSGIGRVLDEPNGDSSCMPTYLLSEFARRQVTVVVSGDGGDEMFAGYGRYFHTLEDEQNRVHSHGWHPGDAYYSERILVSTEQYIEELFGVVPEGLGQHLDRLRGELDDAKVPFFCRLRRTDVENYLPGAVLPKVDRMSMQHSLEVRTPFLNMELARFAERLPLEALYRDGLGKRLLREVAYRYLPRKLIDAPKKGFGIPMSRWGRDALLGVASTLLEGEDSRMRQALGAKAMNRFLARQRSKDGFSTYQVWSLAVLESWLRHHPATLQDIPEALRSTRSRARASGIGVCKVLVAWPIGDNVYRVLEEVDHDSPSGWTVAPGKDPTDQVPIRLPAWGEHPRPEDTEQFVALRGATLVLGDLDHSRKIDRKELEKYSTLGVTEIKYHYPYSPGTFMRICLQNKTLLQRMVAAFYLRRRVVAKLGWGKRIKFIIQVISGRLPEGQKLLFGPLRRVHFEQGQEMSHKFMLFEGLTQMPPIPVPHTDIAEKGNGRYSVWNGFSIFSTTRLRRLLTHSYWMVEHTPETERHLQYVCSIIPPDPAALWRLAEVLEEKIETDACSPAASAFAASGPIVVFTHALPPGGAERQWCYLASALQGLGEQVVFVTIYDQSGHNRHYRPLLDQNGIHTIELSKQPKPDILRSNIIDRKVAEILFQGVSPLDEDHLLRLIGLLHTLKPRAIVTQLDYPNLLAATAGLLANVPRVILSFRNYNPSHFSYLKNDWFQRYYRAVASSPRIVFTGNARDASEDYADWIGIDAECVHWIPNAISSSDVKRPTQAQIDSLRAELCLPPQVPVVLGVFRLSEEKRPLLFLQVCAELRKQFPDLRVFIAGIGPMEDAMKQMIAQSGMEECITMLGRREDVPALISIASLFLLTSTKEGMPNAVMEAQMLGLPVVAVKVGGVPDVVEDGVMGLLVEGENPASFVLACVRILNDEVLAKQMGQAGTLHMEKFFSKSAMASRYMSVIACNPNPTSGRTDRDSIVLHR